MNDDFDKIEDDLKRKEIEERKEQEMPVSGKSVFNIQKLLHKNKDSKENK